MCLINKKTPAGDLINRYEQFAIKSLKESESKVEEFTEINQVVIGRYSMFDRVENS